MNTIRNRFRSYSWHKWWHAPAGSFVESFWLHIYRAV